MPTEWKQLGQTIDGDDAYDLSGWSVSLNSDGTIVAIGAYGNDDNGNQSGQVRVFQFTADINVSNDGGKWRPLGQSIIGDAANDVSGRSVSLNGDGTIVAIGATGNDDNAGQVRVFQYNSDTSTWNQLGQDIDGDAAYDLSGYSVSLSSDGKIVAIGAPISNDNGINAGQVRVYYSNNNPVITSSATFSVSENQQSIEQVTSTDADGDTLTYSITGSEIAIDTTGNLSFVDTNGADFETKSSYTATVTVSDGTNSTSQDITVNVTNVNDNSPVITSSATFSVSENQQSIEQVTATDADGDTLTYSITGSEIAIDTTGNLSFVDANGADFETKSSYTATVTVSDGTNSRSQDITVNVTNVNDNSPTIGIRIIREREGVVKPGESISYEIVVEPDVFGDIATITSTEEPAWLRFTDNGDNTASLVGTAEEKGEYNFRIDATVGLLTRVEEIELEVVSDNLSVNAVRALASIQLQIQEGVDATKGKLLLQILGTILQNNRDVDKNELIIQMITSLNLMLNDM